MDLLAISQICSAFSDGYASSARNAQVVRSSVNFTRDAQTRVVKLRDACSAAAPVCEADFPVQSGSTEIAADALGAAATHSAVMRERS
jgi:hypothetical protein